MTLRDIYHYPTQHYDHHRAQLTTMAALSTEQAGQDVERSGKAHP